MENAAEHVIQRRFYVVDDGGLEPSTYCVRRDICSMIFTF